MKDENGLEIVDPSDPGYARSTPSSESPDSYCPHGFPLTAHERVARGYPVEPCGLCLPPEADRTALEQVALAYLQVSGHLDTVLRGVERYIVGIGRHDGPGLPNLDKPRLAMLEISQRVVMALASPGPELPPQQLSIPALCNEPHIPPAWLGPLRSRMYREDEVCPNCASFWERDSKSYCMRCRAEHEAERRQLVCQAAAELLEELDRSELMVSEAKLVRVALAATFTNGDPNA